MNRSLRDPVLVTRGLQVFPSKSMETAGIEPAQRSRREQTPCRRWGWALCPPEGCWSEHCVVDQPQEGRGE